MLRNPSASARQRLVEAQQQLQSWAAMLHATSPEYKDLRYPEPLNLKQAQAALPDDRTALVSFILDTPASYAFVVSRNGFNRIRLPSRRLIEPAVTALRSKLSVPPKPGAPAFEDDAARLYRSVFQPLQPSLRGRTRIVLVPDGMLHYLPFEALLSSRNRFLAEDYTIAYAPSASVLHSLSRRRRSTAPSMDLLAFADPATATGTPRSEMRSVLERQGLALGPIPNARIEVDRISRLYPPSASKTFTGAAATEDAFKHEPLARYRQIHMATHAVIDEHLPIRSGIVLSPSGKGEDGLLTLAEIYNLKLDADLVTLSACQSGLGKLVRGEGLIGLTRALFYAGANRVAVSLWNVNDVATAPFMERVYRAMRAGDSPADALAKAKQQMLRSASAGLRHPYYWAPFVLVGMF
jgi:CHAT domain-containing protein